jgi:hypothetical protein
MAIPEGITTPTTPCPLWLRGECPFPQNPEKDCHLWKSGECRPGLRGDCLNEIRQGEKQFGKVLAPERDPYLMHINYLNNDGGMRPDVGEDSGLLAHPALDNSPYMDGTPPTDSEMPANNAQAVAETEAYRYANVPRPSFNPKPRQP